MTKSTITRERLEEIRDYDTCVTLEESAELARMALAAMDSEPVAYRWNYGGTTIWRLLDTKPGPGSNPRCPRVIEPLYRHAQQPVVPQDVLEVVNRRAAMLQGAKNSESRCGIQTAPALDSFKKNAESRCGNSPVIPGWIPVSERMPETYVNVLLTDEHGDVCIGQLEFEGDIYFYVVGSTHRHKATHWMPTPAAPQEVKSESCAYR